MSVINTGKSFSNGEQLTADKLNQSLSEATFGTDAFDGTSIQLTDVGSKLGVRDLGVSTAKLADDAVTTAKIENGAVTKAKIENVNDMKVLGNVSGVTASPSEVGIIDDDTMATASATTLATSESIKAYVDTTTISGFTPSSYNGEESIELPNGLVMKFGKLTSVSLDQTFHAVSYGDAFEGVVISVQATIHMAGIVSGNIAPVIKGSGLTGFDVAGDTSNATSTGDINWFAIGY